MRQRTAGSSCVDDDGDSVHDHLVVAVVTHPGQRHAGVVEDVLPSPQPDTHGEMAIGDCDLHGADMRRRLAADGHQDRRGAVLRETSGDICEFDRSRHPPRLCADQRGIACGGEAEQLEAVAHEPRWHRRCAPDDTVTSGWSGAARLRTRAQGCPDVTDRGTPLRLERPQGWAVVPPSRPTNACLSAFVISSLTTKPVGMATLTDTG